MNYLKYLPKNYLSYGFGKVAELPLPKPINSLVLNWFSKAYNIDLSEAEKELKDYSSLSDFFTRRLKKGARPIDSGIVHPCDSTITEFGLIEDQTLIQAKGMSYKLIDLVRSQSLAEDLRGGFFITYYLCPADYHRVHSPADLIVHSCRHIPGQLWPVNAWSVKNIENLFPQNERLVARLEIEKSPAALVMVGATNVGKMTLNFDSQIVTNNLSRKLVSRDYKPPILMRAGDPFGVFHMGSTVIMLYCSEFIGRFKDLKSGPVRMGKSLSSAMPNLIPPAPTEK